MVDVIVPKCHQKENKIVWEKKLGGRRKSHMYIFYICICVYRICVCTEYPGETRFLNILNSTSSKGNKLSGCCLWGIFFGTSSLQFNTYEISVLSKWKLFVNDRWKFIWIGRSDFESFWAYAVSMWKTKSVPAQIYIGSQISEGYDNNFQFVFEISD